jgi:replicative DNA helicase
MPKFRAPRTLADGEWARLVRAMNELRVDHMRIVDGAMCVADIASLARLYIAKRGQLDLVVVDYLQMVKPAKREQMHEREVAGISSDLKRLAIDLNIPVLVLAQLNRGVANRAGNAPFLSDLRESGSVEQDADLVIFVHRPAYYDAGLDPRIAEIIVAKHRNGETGKFEVNWDAQAAAFTNAPTVQHAVA